jgi:NDP-hexose-3-ketoreductase
MGFEMENINLGIIGCAKVVYPAVILPVRQCRNLRIQGIASRNLAKAQSYAAQCKIANVYQNYDALLADEAVDLVYIALPNHLHGAMIRKAAEARKHIWVEKPLCLDVTEFAAVRSACAKHRVQLLEGIMVQHHPWQSYLKQYIQDRRLGALQKVRTQISFIPKYDLAGNYRSHPEYGGGCFFDLSPYWLQFIQVILGLEPDSYEGCSDFSGINRSDFAFAAQMRFRDGVAAEFAASFEQAYTANHELIFTQGRLRVENFFRANLGKHQIALQIENWESGATEVVAFPPQNYYLNQLEFLVKVVAGETANIDLEESGQRVKLMELIYRDARQREKGAEADEI